MDYIEFPYLHLQFKINPVAFSVGNFEIHWYGLIIALAFLTATVLAFRACAKHDIKIDDLIDYVIFALPSAIICARLYYVIFSSDTNYWSDPITILYIWEGGLAIYGALIGIFISVYFVARYKKQKLLPLLDFAMPYILLAQGIGRWGNFVNQEAWGLNTTNIFAMTGNRIKTYLTLFKQNGMNIQPELGVHPTFLYESFWAVMGFIALMYFYKHFKKRNGEVLWMYFIIYGIERFFVEGLRLDSLLIQGTDLRVSQLLSAVLVVAGLLLLFGGRSMQRRKERKAALAAEAAGEDELVDIPVEEDKEITVNDKKDE